MSILNKATAKNSSLRFQTCEQFKQALVKKELQESADDHDIKKETVYSSETKTNKTTTISPRESGASTAALILGIIGLILFWFPIINLILGISAISLGSRGQKDSNGNDASNKGLGTAGIVLGSITTLIGLFVSFAVLTNL